MSDLRKEDDVISSDNKRNHININIYIL